MTPWELLGLVGLVCGVVSASAVVLIAVAELRYWLRRRRWLRRLDREARAPTAP